MAPPSRPTLGRVSDLAQCAICRHILTSLIQNESMQKYMLLSAQKEALQRRMAMEIPSNAPMTVSSPEFQSLSSSPTWSPKYAMSYPIATDPVPIRTSTSSRSNSIDDMHTDEAHKLSEINHQIIATLTELLNTESVRSDDKHRAWIQERLMEVEHSTRRERRRHSSIAERDFASAIAQNLELGLNTSKTWA